MRTLALAIVAALTLGACATPQTSTGNGATATAAAGTKYCWKERLTSGGGSLNCNWAATKREACEVLMFSDVPAGRHTAPKDAGRCSNGQWLVEVAPT